MRKLMIAAALAAPCVAFAQSNVTVSGGFVMGYKYTAGKSDGTKSRHGIDNLEAAGSNLTFRGVEDLGNGYKASFVLNHRFDPSTGEQSRGSYFTNTKLALSGGFGEVAMGKMWAPVDELLRRVLDVYMPLGSGVHVYSGPFDAPTRYNGTLMYTTPDFSGFRASGAFVSKGNMKYAPGAHEVNTSELALRYMNGPLTLGLGYTQNAGDTASATFNIKDRDVLTVGARYNFSKLNIGLTYSGVSAPQGGNDSDRYSLGARYPLTNALTAKAGYERFEKKGEDANKMALGLEYRVSKRTMFFTEASRINSQDTKQDEKNATFMVGIAHRF